MKTRFKKSYLKDLTKLPHAIREKIQELSFSQVPTAKGLDELIHAKKIKGYKNFYRIRIGDYRIGFEIRDETIIFYRVLHRKDIYKYFP